MTQPGANDWKTPLGYYERAIAELTKVREQLQAELQALKNIQTSQKLLKTELQETKQELKNTNQELQETNNALNTFAIK